MYYNGQIVWDIDAKALVRVGGPRSEGSQFAWDKMPKRSTHMMRTLGGYGCGPSRYEIAPLTDSTIEDAQILMNEGFIFPCPIPPHKYKKKENP